MRIAHVAIEIVPSANGAFVGGLVKNLATIAAAQVASGDDVHIFTSNVGNRARPTESTPYGTLHRIRTRGAYGSLPFALSFIKGASSLIARVHREQPFDVIHIHSAYAMFGGFAELLHRLPKPKVFSLYSPNFSVLPAHDCGRVRLSSDFVARRFLRAFESIIVPSLSMWSRVVRLGLSDEAVNWIPPALSPSMFQPVLTREDAQDALGLAGNGPLLLYLGNFSQWKGVEEVLRALSRVRRHFPQASLLAVWGEPYEWAGNRRESVMALIDNLGLRDAVHHAGIVEDVRTVLRAADVLVSPFHCTCKVLDYPLSLLEAMACGTPVISTRVGGIPEIIDASGGGLLVDPMDITGLSKSIESMLTNPGLAREMGVAGSRFVRGQFRAGTIEAAVRRVYLKASGRVRFGG